jgi:hypothetical protein
MSFETRLRRLESQTHPAGCTCADRPPVGVLIDDARRHEAGGNTEAPVPTFSCPVHGTIGAALQVRIIDPTIRPSEAAA